MFDRLGFVVLGVGVDLPAIVAGAEDIPGGEHGGHQRVILFVVMMHAVASNGLEIGELADRIERLGASPAPHFESAEMAALLAEACRQIEHSTPPAALVSIE